MVDQKNKTKNIVLLLIGSMHVCILVFLLSNSNGTSFHDKIILLFMKNDKINSSFPRRGCQVSHLSQPRGARGGCRRRSRAWRAAAGRRTRRADEPRGQPSRKQGRRRAVPPAAVQSQPFVVDGGVVGASRRRLISGERSRLQGDLGGCQIDGGGRRATALRGVPSQGQRHGARRWGLPRRGDVLKRR